MFDIFTQNLYYLDPGTGSYLYQIIIATGVTLGVYYKSVKVFVINILNKFKKNTKNGRYQINITIGFIISITIY